MRGKGGQARKSHWDLGSCSRLGRLQQLSGSLSSAIRSWLLVSDVQNHFPWRMVLHGLSFPAGKHTHGGILLRIKWHLEHLSPLLLPPCYYYLILATYGRVFLSAWVHLRPSLSLTSYGRLRDFVCTHEKSNKVTAYVPAVVLLADCFGIPGSHGDAIVLKVNTLSGEILRWFLGCIFRF